MLLSVEKGRKIFRKSNWSLYDERSHIDERNPRIKLVIPIHNDESSCFFVCDFLNSRMRFEYWTSQLSTFHEYQFSFHSFIRHSVSFSYAKASAHNATITHVESVNKPWKKRAPTFHPHVLWCLQLHFNYIVFSTCLSFPFLNSSMDIGKWDMSYKKRTKEHAWQGRSTNSYDMVEVWMTEQGRTSIESWPRPSVSWMEKNILFQVLMSRSYTWTCHMKLLSFTSKMKPYSNPSSTIFRQPRTMVDGPKSWNSFRSCSTLFVNKKKSRVPRRHTEWKAESSAQKSQHESKRMEMLKNFEVNEKEKERKKVSRAMPSSFSSHHRRLQHTSKKEIYRKNSKIHRTIIQSKRARFLCFIAALENIFFDFAKMLRLCAWNSFFKVYWTRRRGEVSKKREFANTR